MNRHEKIVITGIGVASAGGYDVPSVVTSLMEARSWVRTVDQFDASQHPSHLVSPIGKVPLAHGYDAAAYEPLHPGEKLARWCSVEALRDAGLYDRRQSRRVATILGSASESMMSWDVASMDGTQEFPCRPEDDRPPLVPTLHRELGLTGPHATISAACASGNVALAQARRWLQLGWADACLAGAVDAALTPMTLACFGNLRALTRNNDHPQQAARPFDRDRDGFVLAEGGVMFVLEREESARKRGAKIYGELAGCGFTSDAFHPVIPCPEPAQAMRAMRLAMADAGVNPAEIDYLNAHGTGTPVGDTLESKAIREVFGDDYRRIPVSSTKSMTGHLLTSAAALEALVCLASIADQVVPPTINLDNVDPECDLCHVPHQAQPRRVRVAMSNSLGFGGSNSCAIFRAA